MAMDLLVPWVSNLNCDDIYLVPSRFKMVHNEIVLWFKFAKVVMSLAPSWYSNAKMVMVWYKDGARFNMVYNQIVLWCEMTMMVMS